MSFSRKGVCTCNGEITCEQLNIQVAKISTSSSADKNRSSVSAIIIDEFITTRPELFSEYIHDVSVLCPMVAAVYSCEECARANMTLLSQQKKDAQDLTSSSSSSSSSSSITSKKLPSLFTVLNYCLGNNSTCICSVIVVSILNMEEVETKYDGILVSMGSNRALIYVDTTRPQSIVGVAPLINIVKKFGKKVPKKLPNSSSSTNISSSGNTDAATSTVVDVKSVKKKRVVQPTLIEETTSKGQSNGMKVSDNVRNRFINLKLGSNHQKNLQDLYYSDCSNHQSDSESIDNFVLNSSQDTVKSHFATPSSIVSSLSENSSSNSVTMEVSAEKKTMGIAESMKDTASRESLFNDNQVSSVAVPLDNCDSSLFPNLQNSRAFPPQTCEKSNMYVSASGFENDSFVQTSKVPIFVETIKIKTSPQRTLFDAVVATTSYFGSAIEASSPKFSNSVIASSSNKYSYSSPEAVERKTSAPVFISKVMNMLEAEPEGEIEEEQVHAEVVSSNAFIDQGSFAVDGLHEDHTVNTLIDDDFLHVTDPSEIVSSQMQGRNAELSHDPQVFPVVIDQTIKSVDNDSLAIHSSLQKFEAIKCLNIYELLQKSLVSDEISPIDCGKEVQLLFEKFCIGSRKANAKVSTAQLKGKGEDSVKSALKLYQSLMKEALKARFGHSTSFTKYFCKLCIIDIVTNIELIKNHNKSYPKKDVFQKSISFAMSRLQLALGSPELIADDILGLFTFNDENKTSVLLKDLLAIAQYSPLMPIDNMVFVMKNIYSKDTVWTDVEEILKEFDHRHKMFKPSPIKSLENKIESMIEDMLPTNNPVVLEAPIMDQSELNPPALKRTNSLINKEKKLLSHRDSFGTRKEVTRSIQNQNPFTTLPSNISAGANSILTRSSTLSSIVRTTSAVQPGSPGTDNELIPVTNRLKRSRTTTESNIVERGKHVLFSPSPKKQRTSSRHINTDSSASTVDASFNSPAHVRSRVRVVAATPMS